MPARLPDFLGVGTQKGGTTSLHQWLGTHPQVFLPSCKEVHYFDQQAEKPISWYTQHFKESREKQTCGEITPLYLFHPNVPSRIHKILPEVKLIVLLRDPVERSLSHIFHARKRGFEYLMPEEAIEAEASRLQSGDPASLQKHSYVSRSRYLEQLDRYESLFSEHQILVVKSEKLFGEPDETWYQILNFLKLKPKPFPQGIPRANQGSDRSALISKTLRDKLKNKLRATALGVRERYGFGWEWA